MVKMKISYFERVAGFFVLSSMALFFIFMVSLAIKQGWFEEKKYYYGLFDAAEGIHEGTHVQISGIKVGKVESVDLTDDQKIKIKVSVFAKYTDKVKQDSRIQFIRPFVIGDRLVEITAGSQMSALLDPHSIIPTQEVFDLMAVLSGKNIGTYITHLSQALNNVSSLLKAMTDEKRTKSMIRMFDRIDPLLKNVDTMTKEVTVLTQQLTSQKKLETFVVNANQLVEDFQGLGATIKQLGPQLPATSQRAIEALNETVILLKAMQKSFFLNSHVEKVKKEEDLKEQNKQDRLPASSTSD